MSKILLEEQHEPLEIDLKNRMGEIFTVYSNPITLGDLEEFENIGKKKYLKDGTESSVTRDLTNMCIRIFGKDEEFWKQFSIKLLTDLIVKVTEDIKDKNNVKKN